MDLIIFTVSLLKNNTGTYIKMKKKTIWDLLEDIEMMNGTEEAIELIDEARTLLRGVFGDE